MTATIRIEDDLSRANVELSDEDNLMGGDVLATALAVALSEGWEEMEALLSRFADTIEEVIDGTGGAGSDPDSQRTGR